MAKYKPSKLILGTRKGLLLLKNTGGKWSLQRESFSGIPVVFAFYDERTETLWASLEHGHWGPKLHRSKNFGTTWDEVALPQYPDTAEVKPGVKAKLELVWYFAPGGEDRPNRLLLGTNPGGLFITEDNGDSFRFVETLWNHPSRQEFWFGGGRDSAGLSSLFVDPRDSRKIFVGASCGGVFFSGDGGQSWHGRNKGLKAYFMPNPDTEYGHDSHYMTYCGSNPDVLWQQNHCGIFHSKDGGQNWSEVSAKSGPARFGWSIAVDPEDAATAWVVPATQEDMRVAVKRKLCVCRTENSGKTWKTLTTGLPDTLAYDIVYRHALDLSGNNLAFGTTTGNVYHSANRGNKWRCLGNNFPPVYSVRFATA